MRSLCVSRIGAQPISQRQTDRCRLSTRRSSICCAATTDNREPLQPGNGKQFHRVAKLAATLTRELEIPEGVKPLAEYMSLPASQYSVLDAERIERISDDTFRCYVGAIKFISWTVEPVLTLSVVTHARGCTISLLSCTLQGSPSFEALNDQFEASMTNSVTWREGSGPSVKQIASDTSIQVSLHVPHWCAALPVESIGAQVMQSTLRLMVPRFLLQLQRDYHKWAEGDTSRKPLGNGTL